MLRTLAVFGAALAVSAGAQSRSGPPLPFESQGACPFECCTYRTWTVTADTEIHAERKDGSAVAFRLTRGQRAQGVTGVVITTKLGRAAVSVTTTIGSGAHAVTVRPEQPIFVLHYLGEGYWKLWVNGHIISEASPVEITEEPEAVWWAKIRSHGREGWTREMDHFRGIDACGA